MISMGFLNRLLNNQAGNTLAITAAALFPLAGIVGGAIDISRIYLVKTRLQQACDAGALAGRKTMGGGTWDAQANAANRAAERFFDTNFENNAYGSEDLSRTYTEASGKVTGNTSAVVPMTLMKIFGIGSKTVEVECDAEMRLPNTDVMFVLDTTGSMDDPAQGGSVSKISALRTAVKCFYEIVARLDTSETCSTGAPSGGLSDQVQVRFGFVPYAVNVNVGKLLPPSYFADSWNYQSREVVPKDQLYYTYDTQGAAQTLSEERTNVNVPNWGSSKTKTTASDQICRDSLTPTTPSPSPSSAESSNAGTQAEGFTPTVKVDWSTTQKNYSYTEYQYVGWNSNSNLCTFKQRTITFTLKRNKTRIDIGTERHRNIFDHWHYGSIPINISGLKNGTAWKSDYKFVTNLGTNGASKTITWAGCVEERRTVPSTTYDSIETGTDLDIDTVPSLGIAGSFWGPLLNGVIYPRKNGTSDWSYPDEYIVGDYAALGSASCPSEARKLQAWSDASTFEDYVNKLKTGGATYHDIGLLWGARLASPTGLFADDNDFTPGGGEIQRHIIFMTDGETNANNTDYNAYGLPWFDRRQQADKTKEPSKAYMDSQVNARFLAVCNEVKKSNKTTLWVVSFGVLSQPTPTTAQKSTEKRLSDCATPGRFFSASSAASLQTTFNSIANQISQLRLTK